MAEEGRDCPQQGIAMKQLGFTHESTHNESKEWYTPPEIFKALNLDFDLDVASPGAEFVPWIPATNHLTILDNGLATPWSGRVWLNPPYGSDTPEWIARFCKYDGEGIMLVFARTDTRWFHQYAVKCDAFLFIRGRVKFIRGDGYCGAGCGA
ncbi:unnamed protein product, partial [marine sediment metagenome]